MERFLKMFDVSGGFRVVWGCFCFNPYDSLWGKSESFLLLFHVVPHLLIIYIYRSVSDSDFLFGQPGIIQMFSWELSNYNMFKAIPQKRSMMEIHTSPVSETPQWPSYYWRCTRTRSPGQLRFCIICRRAGCKAMNRVSVGQNKKTKHK